MLGISEHDMQQQHLLTHYYTEKQVLQVEYPINVAFKLANLRAERALDGAAVARSIAARLAQSHSIPDAIVGEGTVLKYNYDISVDDWPLNHDTNPINGEG